MTTMNATKARAELYRLLEEVATTHEPVTIRGKKGSAILIAEEDWRSVQETLHLLSVPGMRDRHESLPHAPALRETRR